VKPSLGGYVRRQDGYTLVELIIATALGALLMSALVSVVLTTSQAANIAISRVEASSQIRSFHFFAPQDFASSTMPASSSECKPSTPCTTPIALSEVTYSWDGSNRLSRVPASTGVARSAATNVSRFSWYATTCTVVVSVTVTVQAYSESQTFKFRPRVNCP
jgi:prepilin-type N-terminal cleavage/methylation domain-containing protein